MRWSCVGFHSTFRTRFLAIFTIVAACVSNLSTTGLAADEEATSIDYPLVLINAASVQRWKDHAGFMFSAAQRPDMVDAVEKFSINTLKDLNGIDRERPFGMMLYLASDFISAPIGISYVPITNLDDALQTLGYGVASITAVDGKKGWNNIRYGENFLVRTREVGGYLFMVGPVGDQTTLNRNFPDPSKLSSRLSTQYDLAVSLLIRNVQPLMKTLFIEAFKTSALATLQRRDDEPESAYRLRRANGEGWIDLLDKVVSQGEEFTIGAKISPDQRQANFDIEVAGATNSKLAKFFQDMAGKRTYFGNLLSNPSTFTMSASWLLSEKQRPLLQQFFEAAQKDIASKSTATNLSAVTDPLFKVLDASVETGHIDAFAQLLGNEPGKFALIGGTKLTASRNLPDQIMKLLQYAKDNAASNPQVARMELAATEIDSLPVHRLEINPPDAQGQKMFGETAHLYLCATSQAIWVAFGGDTALESLKEAIAQTALPQDPQQNRNRAPFVFVTHANNWLSVADDSTPRREAFNEQAKASFEPTNDSMQLSVRPTDTGLRLRIEFEEGFIALMGRGFAKGIETGAFTPRPGNQQRQGRQRGGNAPNRPSPNQKP